jgi:hypothetical protein
MMFIGECYNYTGLNFGYDSHCDVVALDLVCDLNCYHLICNRTLHTRIAPKYT